VKQRRKVWKKTLIQQHNDNAHDMFRLSVRYTCGRNASKLRRGSTGMVRTVGDPLVLAGAEETAADISTVLTCDTQISILVRCAQL